MARFTECVPVLCSCIIILMARLSRKVDAQACSANSCILPVPSVTASGVRDYQEAVLAVNCQLSCVQQNNITLPILNQERGWPFLNFSALHDNCLLHSKLLECTFGCVTHFKDSDSTSNMCRNTCHSNCMSGLCVSNSACELPYATSCPKECRRTFCKAGCKVYKSITSSTTVHPKPATPVEAPALSAVVGGGSAPWLYTMDLGSREVMQPALPQTVGYIVKIQPLGGGSQVTYLRLWDLTVPLDLGAFACSSVSVSFAVVSLYNVSEFSPSTEFCIPGLAGRPSQVEASSITVSYTEDFSAGALGYAVANISWNRPENAQFLTSYTLRLLTTASQGCSSSTRLYTYHSISQDATHFTLYPVTTNAVLKFGCTYDLQIISQPAVTGETGTAKTIEPELTSPPSEIILECHKVWEEGSGGGTFRVELEWYLADPDSTPIDTLSEFVVNPSLIDNNTYALRRLYSQHIVGVQENRLHYSFAVTNLTPERNANHTYEIQVRGNRNSLYPWRRLPRRAFCIVPSSSQPPSAITNISISDAITFHLVNSAPAVATGQLAMGVSWVQPHSLHELTMYELRIGHASYDVLQQEEKNDPTVIYLQRFSPPARQLHINTTVALLRNQTRHCHEAYIQMRAENEYGTFGEWSEPLVAQLTDCSEPPNGHVAVYFENETGSTKLLELECTGPGLTSNSTSITQRLQAIDERLEGVIATNRLSSLEDKLTVVEQKLDMLITLLSPNDP